MNLPADIYNDLKIIMQLTNRKKAKEAADLENKAQQVNQAVNNSQKSLANVNPMAISQQLEELAEED